MKNQIKKRLSEILNTYEEDIVLKLNKNKDSCFIFNCYVKIYSCNFTDLTDSEDKMIKYTNQMYQEQHEDEYDEEYKANGYFDYFVHLSKYLKLYLKNIYGLCPYLYVDEISTITEEVFTKHGVNPFIYNQNIIPFKEIRTETKDITNVTIMKMGFVLNGSIMEKLIKKDKD